MQNYAMTKSQKRKLSRIAKKIVIQSWDHRENIIKYLKIIKDAVDGEFIEDNKPTRNAFMDECYREAMGYVKK